MLFSKKKSDMQTLNAKPSIQTNIEAQFGSGENKKDKKVSGKLMFSYVWFNGEIMGKIMGPPPFPRPTKFISPQIENKTQ